MKCMFSAVLTPLLLSSVDGMQLLFGSAVPLYCERPVEEDGQVLLVEYILASPLRSAPLICVSTCAHNCSTNNTIPTLSHTSFHRICLFRISLAADVKARTLSPNRCRQGETSFFFWGNGEIDSRMIYVTSVSEECVSATAIFSDDRGNLYEA